MPPAAGCSAKREGESPVKGEEVILERGSPFRNTVSGGGGGVRASLARGKDQQKVSGGEKWCG